MEIGELTTILG